MDADLPAGVRVRRPVAVVDIGMGNLQSVASALTFVGASPHLVSEPEELESFELMVLPGVGSFRTASERLGAVNLDEALVRRVESGAALLGVCLGMQLLGVESTEDGHSRGLGLVDMRVERFSEHEVGHAPIPHVGFSPVDFEPHPIMEGIPSGTDFYFVHSFRSASPIDGAWCAETRYGLSFVSAVSTGSVFGTQFHPEKSQGQGLRLLSNFLRMNQ